MDRPWFDPQSGLFILDDYVLEMPSFKKMLEDKGITEQEVHDQAVKTASLLKKLESMLSPEAHHVATQALCELTVLHAVHLRRGHMHQ
jgi:hypothetical protein